jgi:hypothetical protein
MTTNDTPHKRLMVPVINQPQVLITGDPVSGFAFWGPVPDEDYPNHWVEARTRVLDDNDTWIQAPLNDPAGLAPCDGFDDPPACPIEAKRAEFLTLAAESRRLLAEAERLADAANEPGQDHLAEQASSQGEQGYELAGLALRLAEELLA